VKTTESAEQQALFQWVAIASAQKPELRLLHAIPNGGKRSKITAVILKREGVKSGVFDLSLPVARHGYHGLYIELKIKGGKLSDNQKEWLQLTTEQGYKSIVYVGWVEAKEAIEKYLNKSKFDGREEWS